MSENKRQRFSVSSPANTAIAEMLADEQQPIGSVEYVPLPRIRFDPEQPRKLGLDRHDPAHIAADDPDAERKREELAELQEMAGTIRAQGVVQPVGVYLRGNDYMLIWGERRVLASVLLGLEHIKAYIFPDRPKNLRAQQLIENMFRRDLSLKERINGIAALRAEPGTRLESAADLMELLGASKTTAFRYWSVLNGPSDVLEAINAGTLTRLKTAESIAAIDDADARRDALIAATGGSLEDEDGTASKSSSPADPGETQRGESRRGRPATAIQLGRTKSPALARYIVERLVDKKEFTELGDVKWDDLSTASDIVRQVIKRLEDKFAKAAAK